MATGEAGTDNSVFHFHGDDKNWDSTSLCIHYTKHAIRNQDAGDAIRIGRKGDSLS